jgi:hypothetical protein
MEVNEYLPNLDVIRCIGTFLSTLFSNVISIKTTRAARKKYLQYGGHPSMTSSRDVTASPLYDILENYDQWSTENKYVSKITNVFILI